LKPAREGERGSQDSNLGSPVLETGALAIGAALASRMRRRIAPRERQRERTAGEIPQGDFSKRRAGESESERELRVELAVEALAPFLGFFVAAARIAAVAVDEVAQDGGASGPAVAEGIGGALELLGKFMLGLAARVDRF
jgi:hypothetical protein